MPGMRETLQSLGASFGVFGMCTIFRVGLVASSLAIGGASSPTRADDFDRLEGKVLADLPAGPDAAAHRRLSVEDIGALPRVLKGLRTAAVVVKTDRGNLCRVLVAPGLRKSPNGQGEPFPVLVLERFTTFEGGPATTRIARGRDLLLYDGFRIDLDSGQVVPEGQGEDLRFVAKADGGPALEGVGEVRLYTLKRSPLSDTPAAGQPSVGRAVVPTDYDGRYHLYANGQWSGVLDLKTEGYEVGGKFRSEQTGSVYPVEGQIDLGSPNLVRFRVTFPRTHQDYEGRLWTEGKGAMAGSATLLDRTFGFFALREGGRFAPEGDEIAPLPDPDKPAGQLVIDLRPGAPTTLDGRALDDDALLAALREAVADAPEVRVLLRATTDTPYRSVARLLDLVRTAGIERVSLTDAAPKDPPR
jgi:hypothetical protein